jgi:hypothetical protein
LQRKTKTTIIDETTMNTTSRPSQVVDERIIPIDDATAATEQVVATLTSLGLTATATSSLVVGNSEASTDADNLVAPQADAFNEMTKQDTHPQKEVEQFDVATGQVVGAHDSMTATGTLPASSEGLTFLRRVETAMASGDARVIVSLNDVIAQQYDVIEQLTTQVTSSLLVLATQNELNFRLKDFIEQHTSLFTSYAVGIDKQNDVIGRQNDTVKQLTTRVTSNAFAIAKEDDLIELQTSLVTSYAVGIAEQNDVIARKYDVIEQLTTQVALRKSDLKDARETVQSARSSLFERLELLHALVAQHQGADQEK